ncbi:MAG: lipoyl(octanoyl) transferase [Flavobacteriaceae bacterium]|nr:lipoyl(octanoyl) transferase [Flavobacteriaceae bacterium]
MNKKLNKNINVYDLGVLDYKTALNFQEKKLQEIIDIKRTNRNEGSSIETPNYFLFVEHPPVITLGKSGQEKNLLLTKEELERKKIQYFNTNRGGDITFHGYGQIVGYPVIDLENFYTDINRYLRTLEEIVILTLNYFKISSQRSSGETGVWLEPNSPNSRKICAIGVKTSRWVTMHGFALNVDTDLRYYDYIIPCGIKGKGITSMNKEIKKNVLIGEVKEKILENLKKTLQANLVFGT